MKLLWININMTKAERLSKILDFDMKEVASSLEIYYLS